MPNTECENCGRPTAVGIEHVPLTFTDVHADPERLLTDAELVALLGVKRQTIAAWRYRGQGPKTVHLTAKSPRTRVRDLIEWIETSKAAN
jgi:predicted DNA-binding transcriptional regulator AlpA